MPLIRRNPPDNLYFLGQKPTKEDIEGYIYQKLQHAFGDPTKHVQSMKFEVFYKGVTYETLKDDAFRKAVYDSRLGALFPDNKIMDEELAAAQRK